MKDKSLKIAFMGTPDFATVSLRALCESKHDVICVYTQPPRPKGRGHKLQKSPVHILAEQHDIPVFTPATLKNREKQKIFATHKIDVAIVAAYGLLLPKEILEIPRYGCLNIHASLLPRWRGASPIQHAIWKGDEKSGITIMQMDEGLDTGPMIAKSETPIDTNITAIQLHNTLANQGTSLTLEILERLLHDDRLEAEKQNDALSTYAPLLKKSDGRIDWTQNATEIDRQIRALNPWPGTQASIQGKNFKIIESSVIKTKNTENIKPGTLLNKEGIIMCGDNSTLKINTLQPEGKKAMDVVSALNGGYICI